MNGWIRIHPVEFKNDVRYVSNTFTSFSFPDFPGGAVAI